MPRDPAALLDRVRKLLALATSPNVHEAAAAAARAQQMILRHNLQALLDAEDAVRAAPISAGRERPLEVSRRLRKWKLVLAAGLAELNGCLAFSERVGKHHQLLLAGRAQDRAVVGLLWRWLVKRIEWCSATEGQGQDRAWHEAFRVGASEVIVARLAASQRQQQVALDGEQRALVVPAIAARVAAVEAFARDRLQLKRGRGLRVDAKAYAEGRAAGAKVPLAP